MSSALERFQNHPRYRLFLALIGAALLSLSWYYPFQLLLPFAMLPLLMLTDSFLQSEEKKQKRKLFRITWLMFILWNIGVYWWLWNAVNALLIVIILLNAAFMSTVVILAFAVGKASGGRFTYAALVCLWLSFEYMHLNWSLTWPWLNLGNAFSFMPEIVQWYEITGTVGGALWVWLINIFAYEAFIKKRLSPVLCAVLLLVPVSYSLFRYFTFEEKGKPAEVIVIQPNFDCYTEKFERNPTNGENNPNYVPYMQQVEQMRDQALEMLSDSTRFVAIPETSMHLDKDINRNLFDYRDMRIINRALVEEKKMVFIGGIDAYSIYKVPEDFQSPDDFPSTASVNPQDPNQAYDKFNSAIQIDLDSKVDVYHKSKLVTGAEANPLTDIIPSAQIMTFFQGLSGSLGKQDERDVFFSKNRFNPEETTGIAPVICYESVYGDYVTEYVRKGAEAIFVITNDGWWGDTPGHVQHLMFSRLRAVETRRSVARSANTGISGFVNQRGDLIDMTAYGEKDAVKGTVLLRKDLTFYAKHGDYIYRLAAFLAAVMSFSALVRSIRKK